MLGHNNSKKRSEIGPDPEYCTIIYRHKSEVTKSEMCKVRLLGFESWLSYQLTSYVTLGKLLSLCLLF